MNIDSSKPVPFNNLSVAQLKAEVEQGKGFLVVSPEVTAYQQILPLIKEQYLHVLQMHCPKKVAKFHDAAMSDYHKIYAATDFEHGSIWNKNARLLGPQAVQTILSGPIGNDLTRLFGDYRIADEENMGWPGIYWRLVRPGNTDIGSVHADKWFWDLGHGYMPQGYKRLKLWMSIHSVPGSSGLQVVPNSHLHENWKYYGERRGGMQKPVLDEDPDSLDLYKVPTQPGHCILFNDKLLHGGMANHSDETRVSLEFTILVPIN